MASARSAARAAVKPPDRPWSDCNSPSRVASASRGWLNAAGLVLAGKGVSLAGADWPCARDTDKIRTSERSTNRCKLDFDAETSFVRIGLMETSVIGELWDLREAALEAPSREHENRYADGEQYRDMNA